LGLSFGLSLGLFCCFLSCSSRAFCLFLHWSLFRLPTSSAILPHRLSTEAPNLLSALCSLSSSAVLHELALGDVSSAGAIRALRVLCLCPIES
jgi:hypothetical protein